MEKDLFEEYLLRKNENGLVKIALTDKSYKNKYNRENRKKYDGEINEDIATLGDSVLKLYLTEILYDKKEKDNDISQIRQKYECDKNLVSVVAKHYDLIKYIDLDDKDSNIPDDYVYLDTKHKYIATAVEALLGAIYKDDVMKNKIKELIISWMNLIDEACYCLHVKLTFY